MAVLGLALALLIVGCGGQAALPVGSTHAPPPTARPEKIPFEATSQQISFSGQDGTLLAGQLDWPPGRVGPPLVIIIHHSGPVARDNYQFLAARLVPAGYAVFRFDKRGTGQSGGQYGCCEDGDALAAYQAAVEQVGFDPSRVFIVAQSIGTEIVARHFSEFEQQHKPAGVILLSSLLENEEVLAIKAPVHIIVSDSESNLSALTDGAVKAHLSLYDYGASFYVASRTEHTLFDISTGPVDWSDPKWPEKFHFGAWMSLLQWLEEH